MTDDSSPDADDAVEVPDTDPRHIDPAGHIAEAFESGEIDAALAADADREELEAFVEQAEAGAFDLRADPGLEAAVRIVRALLDDDARDSDSDEP